MRFFHHKHQCYIVGEGSSVGHCGQFPGTVEEDNEDSGATASIPRTRSLFSMTSLNSHQLQVTVDVEPTGDDVAASTSATKPSLSSDQGIQDGQTSLLDKGSSAVFLPKYQKMLDGDGVVCEDGKL